MLYTEHTLRTPTIAIAIFVVLSFGAFFLFTNESETPAFTEQGAGSSNAQILPKDTAEGVGSRAIITYASYGFEPESITVKQSGAIQCNTNGCPFSETSLLRSCHFH